MLLDERGLYTAVHSAAFQRVPTADLQLWGSAHAVFQFVTIELLDWLKTEIGEAKALEICAGNGVISRSLGIVGVDNRIQQKAYFQRNAIDFYGELHPDNFTAPPREIKNYNANDAVRIFRPEVVVGAFVTPKVTRADNARGIMGNGYGPDMFEMFKRLKKYIHFGNRRTHLPNPIYDLPHLELEYPWLVTRCVDPSLNRVWIWEF